jgi:hypothetical protein
MAVATSTILAGTVLASGAMSAFSQAKAGNTQAKSLTSQGEYNAQVYEQQAGMILEQKKLQDYQFNRNAAKTRGAGVARTAGSGFLFGGSPMAMLIDSETQMQLDKAVGDYNLDVQRNFALSGANYQRGTAAEQAKLARSTGNTNAFSTILNTGTTLGMLNMPRVGKI